jgi:hypothetical protein
MSKQRLLVLDRSVSNCKHYRLLRIFSRWRLCLIRLRRFKALQLVVGHRRVAFLKLKLYFQLWRNRFIYLSRLVLIRSIFSARRNARALSSAFRSFRSFQNNCTRLSQTSISLGTSLLVTRLAVDREFFFTSNVFCRWRRAVRYTRGIVRAQSTAAAIRPMLLQWRIVAVAARPSPFPTRAMHFSELLRAQASSRHILLQPETLLALRQQSTDESAFKRPFWTQPLMPQGISSTPPPHSKLPQPHVIVAKVSPSFLVSQQPSQTLSRLAASSRRPWVPTSVAVTVMAESKRNTGPR